MKRTVIFLSITLALNASAATQPQTIVQNPQAGGIAVQNTGTLNIIQYDIEIIKKLGVTEEKLKITEVAFQKFLEIAGEKQVPIEQLAVTMGQMAERYKSALEGIKNLEQSDDPEVKQLIQQAEQLLRETVDLDQAEKFLNQAHAKKKEKKAHLKGLLHKEEVEQAAISFQTGKVKFAQLKYKEAGEYYRLAAEELPKGEEKLLADYLNSAVFVMLHSGEYAQATPLAEQALNIRENIVGKEHPDTAASLNNLAELYRAQGKYTKLELLYQRSLEIFEKTYGKEHSSIATSLNNLAGLYDSQEKYTQAEPLYLRVLEIREKVLGKEHPDVAVSLNNLALLYYKQDKDAQAEPLHRRSLDIKEKVLGKEHPSVATSLNNLGVLYYFQKNYAQAEPLLLRALNIRENILGKEHPATASSLNNVALLYSAQEKYAQAEPLYLRALEILDKALQDTQGVRENYEKMKQKQQENEKAKEK